MKTFLKENLKENNYHVVAFGDIDSTYMINDSLINVMHQRNNGNQLFKRIDYKAKPTSKLLYIRLEYIVNKDSILQTFYIDDKLQNVVAVKNY